MTADAVPAPDLMTLAVAPTVFSEPELVPVMLML
jgi:hypothetical protein